MSLDVRPQAKTPIRSLEDVLVYFRAAEKPRAAWKVGLEHEKPAVLAGTWDPVPYEGPRGIRELLRRAGRYGYEAYLDGELPVAARLRGQVISLEPGGQVECSGRPAASAREVAGEHLRHSARLRALGAELGIRFLCSGYRPFGAPESMPWMPKRRYSALREYLPTRGAMARHMMLMTASTQASLDWSDEQDCAAKVRAAASVASLLVALFANSPVVDGRPAGMQSFRSQLWRKVDSDRCGLLPLYFDEPGFSYRRWAEWAFGVPAVFFRREGRYVPLRGVPFGRFVAEGHEGEPARLCDFADHLSTLFPEVRVKKVIEVRSPDACDPETSNALPALLRGLLYDPDARAGATALTARLSFPERLELHEAAAREGLRARLADGRLVLDLCRELLRLARSGLRRLGAEEDLSLLEPLEQIARTGRSRADGLLESFERGPDALREACALS